MFVTCSCGTELHLAVQRSAAGYYAGYFCPKCGPYDRISGYFRTREEAAGEVERLNQEALMRAVVSIITDLGYQKVDRH